MKPFSDALQHLREQGLWRRLREIGSVQGPVVRWEGREVICLCSNNYLDLAGDPRRIEAEKKALDTYGSGSGASRLISGHMSPHVRLEEALADFMGTEAALLFGSGYLANAGALDTLAGRGDLLLSDALNHASLIDGCRLSRAETEVFPHGDVFQLEQALMRKTGFSRRMVVTESVFSMDGDLADLSALAALKDRHDAMIYLDEAHAIGVLGPTGAGAAEHFGLRDRIEIRMGTLGKSLGGYGAFIAGSRSLIDWLINRCRSFIYTTGLPPAIAAGALEALRILRGEPDRRRRLWANLRRMRDGLAAQGWQVPEMQSAVIPIRVGGVEATMQLAEALLDRGVLAIGIRPPTVPEGTSRIRCTVMATHTEAHIDRALEAFGEAGRALGLIR